MCQLVVWGIIALACNMVLIDRQCHGASVSALSGKESQKTNENQVIEDAFFWKNVGISQLRRNLHSTTSKNVFSKAKNIIIFVGDGMGPTTITAGRIYKGQQLRKSSAEQETLSFDKFPNTGLAKTYNMDRQVPDSASTATALFSGVKTMNSALGLDITLSKKNATKGRVTSIMNWAQGIGKRTGVVTTTRITHATPAATYAGIFHRDWECDTEIPIDLRGLKHIDIARQLVENEPGKKFNVIMGGGLSPMGAFNPFETRTVEFAGDTEKVCSRGDSRNLTKEWLQIDRGNRQKHFVLNRDTLMSLDVKNVDYVLGLFRNNHITYSIARQEGEPTLAEMVEQAIRVLHRPLSKGFVLMVEGGRIDQAHHQNYARAALQEVFEFDKAVETALRETNANETLIIVTADHSHAMTFNGYPNRGNDILGFGNKTSLIEPYETLTYANGPGFYDHLNLSLNLMQFNSSNFWSKVDQIDKMKRLKPTYRHLASQPLKDETHGGEDVAVFAIGPGSDLIRGVFEQNYVAYVMSYVGCMGPAVEVDETCQSNISATLTSIKGKRFLTFVSMVFLGSGFINRYLLL